MVLGPYLKFLYSSVHSMGIILFDVRKMAEVKSDFEKEQRLGIIKDWLSKQPHLPKNIDDQYLRRFLFTCNFSLEKTKHLIDLFYTIRNQAPEIFSKRDPEDANIQKVLKYIDMVPLPKLTEDKCKLFIYRLADSNPDHYHFTDSLKTFFMVADVRIVTDQDLSEGEIPIFDMSGYSLRHLTKVTLPVVKKYMVYSQEAHPIKLKQIHVLNTPPFLDRCLAIIKPFMRSEVSSLLHFHLPNSATLFDYVPQELLPEEYGGKVGNLAEIKAEWVKKVLEHRDFFLDETKWKVDESKRPTEDKNNQNVFNMQGSFRSLNID